MNNENQDINNIIIYDKLNKLDFKKESDTTYLKNVLEDQTEKYLLYSMGEKEFVENYLPVLYSRMTATTEEEKYIASLNQYYKNWLEMTKNSREVVIIDDNTGEKLYRAPAMFMSSELDTEKLRSVYSQELGSFRFGKLTELINNEVPFIASKKLEHYLDYVKDKIFVNNNKDIKERWKKLYNKYYGTQEETEEVKQIEIKKEEPKVNPLDEMDW